MEGGGEGAVGGERGRVKTKRGKAMGKRYVPGASEMGEVKYRGTLVLSAEVPRVARTHTGQNTQSRAERTTRTLDTQRIRFGPLAPELRRLWLACRLFSFPLALRQPRPLLCVRTHPLLRSVCVSGLFC